MRARRLLAAALACALLAAGAAAAQARRDRVVATVGDDKLTVGDIEARLANVPSFRLKELGPTPDEQRKKALGLIIDGELMAIGARADKLDQRDDVRLRLDEVLVNALEQRLRQEAQASAVVSDAEVAAYYQRHHDRYAAEKRIKIWQIVARTKADAERLLKTIADDKSWNKDPVAKWDELVKKESMDRTTAMRDGSVGFVAPDGTTALPQVRVNPAIYAAADRIKDGEVAPDPVPDGGAWVVVMRRGSVATPERTLEQEAPTIRELLVKRQVAGRMQTMLDELRARYVAEQHPERVDEIGVDVDGDVTGQARPGSLRRAHPAARPGKPLPLDGELR